MFEVFPRKHEMVVSFIDARKGGRVEEIRTWR